MEGTLLTLESYIINKYFIALFLIMNAMNIQETEARVLFLYHSTLPTSLKTNPKQKKQGIYKINM